MAHRYWYVVFYQSESDPKSCYELGLGIAFSLPLGFGVLLIPESPRWYAGQDRWDDALKSIGRLRGNKDNLDHPLVQEDFKEMKDDLDADRQSGTGTWAECFTGQPSGIVCCHRGLRPMAEIFVYSQNWFTEPSSVSLFTCCSNGLEVRITIQPSVCR